ncbi:MOSC domain-containing protein [Methylophaga sp.]|uniref:MOSC domain-containing protein n=1 Tax=Methylophaga sp. TaxID=2024840 RepID=UPI003F69C376
MKVRSVNISLPKPVQYKDKTILTGIFKQAVHERITVTPLNLKGDQQVDLKNHGGEHKAVYGFSSDHYLFWQNKLALDNLPFGKFGENLTIDGLDETVLCIGDQIQVGQSLLEITQPRVPCFKLGLAFELNEMPRLFVENAATGIYFRVIETGSVGAGDAVYRIAADPEELTVQQLFKAYFDKTMPADEKRRRLQRALKIDALSMEWREKVETRLAQS